MTAPRGAAIELAPPPTPAVADGAVELPAVPDLSAPVEGLRWTLGESPRTRRRTELLSATRRDRRSLREEPSRHRGPAS
jgi:hypothetical protein